MKRIVIILIAVGLCLTPGRFLRALEVKNTQGQKMNIEVLKYTKSSGNVRIERIEDGKIFNVKLNLFDAESQTKIVEAAPKARADLDIKLSAGKRRKKQPGSSFMEDQTVTASVLIKNESRDVDFEKGKATAFLVARQTKRFANRDEDYGKILAKQTFNVSLPAGQETKYECKPVTTSYDADRDETNVGGWEYYGYVVIVEDGEGAIHSIETSIGNLKKDLDETPELGKQILGLSKDQTVQKNLTKK